MNAFQAVNDSELVSIEGGAGVWVVAAFVVVGVGLTLVAGGILYKSASNMVGAMQQQGCGGGGSGCSGGESK
jgi:hypothetical protein